MPTTKFLIVLHGDMPDGTTWRRAQFAPPEADKAYAAFARIRWDGPPEAIKQMAELVQCCTMQSLKCRWI